MNPGGALMVSWFPPLRGGGTASESTTEMTGTNYTWDAARHGPKRQRQLLGKEKLAAGDPFSFLTAHANGRPLYRAATCDKPRRKEGMKPTQTPNKITGANAGG